MNAVEARSLLIGIPKEEFITEYFSDSIGKCCSVGHLVRLKSSNPNIYHQSLSDGYNNEVSEFVRVDVSNFLWEKYNQSATLATVNNNPNINGYTQDNPKDRVIALLDDMINTN